MTRLAVCLAVAFLASGFAVVAAQSLQSVCGNKGLTCKSKICSDTCDSLSLRFVFTLNAPLCSTTSTNPLSGCGFCKTQSGFTKGLSFVGTSSCRSEVFNDFLTNGIDLAGILASPPDCNSAGSFITGLVRQYFCISPTPACATDLTCPAADCILDDTVCPCDAGNTKNCGDFPTQELAQACFEKCGGSGSDVHKLDRNRDGVACNSKKKCLQPEPEQGDAPLCAGGMTCPAEGCFVSNDLCPCTSGNTKNCGDFPTKELAQACFEKCNVHGLDGNGDGVACQSRPACIS